MTPHRHTLTKPSKLARKYILIKKSSKITEVSRTSKQTVNVGTYLVNYSDFPNQFTQSQIKKVDDSQEQFSQNRVSKSEITLKQQKNESGII